MITMQALNNRGQYTRCARRTDAPPGGGASAAAATRYSARSYASE
jgi:hypothetical protein